MFHGGRPAEYISLNETNDGIVASHMSRGISATVLARANIVGELAMTPGSRSWPFAAPTSPSALEQPHVLDRDYHLVGEGFQQFDLRRGKGAHLDATRVQYSNKFTVLQKGSG